MSEQGKPVKSLSEISHLFLSNIRDKHAGTGAPRPQRIPPQKPAKAPSVDLTPEEFKEVFAQEDRDREAPGVPEIRAILASHLGPRQLDSIRRYARGLAATQRIGLLYVDASELRILTCEPAAGDAEPAAAPEPVPFDGRAIRDAINELNWDLDLWLLAVGNIKLPEGRALLRAVDHWTALAASDQEGIISCYRMLKGLADIQRPVSLVMIDSAAPAAQHTAAGKIAAVCRQFLNWHVELAAPTADAAEVNECPILHCAAPHDKAQPANPVHWQAIQDLLEHAKLCATTTPAPIATPTPTPTAEASPADAFVRSTGFSLHPHEQAKACTTSSDAETPPAPEAVEMSPIHPPQLAPSSPLMPEVIDLPIDAGPAILPAILRHGTTDLVECPVRPPMCPEARLAVGRDRRLVLIATAGQGLAELRTIGQAYRWVVENRPLLAMAMPQFALDTHHLPHVRLFVDQADLAADLLQPLLQVDTIRIQTYRRIRWGQRTGLLLDAA